MPPNQELFRIAVLDDYQNVALSMADWSVLDGQATITVFNDHLSDIDAIVARLQPFDVVCVMRERTPMTRAIIERLPTLRLIASTAVRNASIDLEAVAEHGIEVVHTGYSSSPTIEWTWALILGQCAQSRPRKCVAARRGLAAFRRRRPRRADARRSRSGQCRRRSGPDRQGFRHGSDRLEPEPDARECLRRRRQAGRKGRVVPAGGHRHRPSRAQQSDAWARRRPGTGAHEAHGAPGEHVARSNCGRGRSAL